MQLVVGYLKAVQIGQVVRLRIDKNAFTRNSAALARSLGFDEAPKPRVGCTRVLTLTCFSSLVRAR